MQIQQQLLMQNQALTQLLQQSGPVSGQTASSTTPMPSMVFNQSVASAAGLNQSASSYTLPTRVTGNLSQTETVTTTVFESSRKLSHDQERKLQEQLMAKFSTLGASNAKPLTDKQMSKAFRHFEKQNQGQRLPLSELQVQEQYLYFISRMPEDDLSSYNDKELLEQFQGHLKQFTANNYYQHGSGSFDSLTEQELRAQYKEYVRQNLEEDGPEAESKLLTEAEFRREFQALLREQEKLQQQQQQQPKGLRDRSASIDHLEQALGIINIEEKASDPKRLSMMPSGAQGGRGTKSFPNTPKLSTASQPDQSALAGGMMLDPYSRARTVRIGKWRWPPPKELLDKEAEAEGEFESY